MHLITGDQESTWSGFPYIPVFLPSIFFILLTQDFKQTQIQCISEFIFKFHNNKKLYHKYYTSNYIICNIHLQPTKKEDIFGIIRYWIKYELIRYKKTQVVAKIHKITPQMILHYIIICTGICEWIMNPKSNHQNSQILRDEKYT